MKKAYKPDFAKPDEIYTEFHRRELWGFLENLYKWKGFPDTVETRFFNRLLLRSGFAPFLTYNGDIITCDGAAHGLDMYLRDTRFNVSNPFLKGVEREVGKDCAICFNTLNYRQPESCDLLVEIFARRLAQIDISLDVSLKNSRASIIVVVDSAEDALKIAPAIENMYHGDAAIITTAKGWKDNKEIFPLSPRDNIISAELADCRNNVMAQFYEYLGIDTIAVDKKERTNLAEMDSNAQQLFINGLRMDAARERFCEDVEKVFGLSIDFEKNKPDEIVKGVNPDDKSMSAAVPDSGT